MQTRGSASLLGLDYSSYQTITNQTTLLSASPHYNILRAYGSVHTAPDTTFLARAQMYTTAGIPSGGYYFATPTKAITVDSGVECDTQCDQFIAVLQQAYGTGKYGEITPMLDVESWGGTTPQHPMYDGLTGDQLIDWVKRFRDRFFTATNRRLGFYSNRYFLQDPSQMNISDAKLTEINNMPLWLAEYDQYYPNNTIDANSPANLGGWTTYVLWQSSGTATASDYGLSEGSNQVDLDRTDSIDRLLVPPAPTNIVVHLPDSNTFQVSFTRPNIVDYLGCSLYVNGTWKQWLPKSAVNDLFSLDVTNTTTYPKNTDMTYQLVVEDTYSDFGYSPILTTQLIIISDPPPPPQNQGADVMPTVAMGTMLKKGVTEIALLTKIDGLNLKADTVETTALDTTGGYKTFLAVLKDSGEVSISGHFDHTAHADFLADFEALTVQSYTIEFPDKLTTTGTTWSFSALVSDFHTSVDLGSLIKFEATLKVSGKPTLAAPV